MKKPYPRRRSITTLTITVMRRIWIGRRKEYGENGRKFPLPAARDRVVCHKHALLKLYSKTSNGRTIELYFIYLWVLCLWKKIEYWANFRASFFLGNDVSSKTISVKITRGKTEHTPSFNPLPSHGFHTDSYGYGLGWTSHGFSSQHKTASMSDPCAATSPTILTLNHSKDVLGSNCFPI